MTFKTVRVEEETPEEQTGLSYIVQVRKRERGTTVNLETGETRRGVEIGEGTYYVSRPSRVNPIGENPIPPKLHYSIDASFKFGHPLGAKGEAELVEGDDIISVKILRYQYQTEEYAEEETE